MRAVHPQDLLAVAIDCHLSYLAASFDEVGGIDDGIGLIFLPLLQILAVIDSGLHRPYFPHVFRLCQFLVLVLLYLVLDYLLILGVVGCFIVQTRFVSLFVNIFIQLIDMLPRIAIKFYFIIPEYLLTYLTILT